ncbi:MAG: glycosyltransferase [Pseudobdellovibrionaceae bacterium]
MTAFQAAICGHEVVLYASSDSLIIPFTQAVAGHLNLSHTVSANGQSITVKTEHGREGSVTLRSSGIPAIGYSDPDEQAKNHALWHAFLADEAQNPYDIIHSHVREVTGSFLIPANLGHKTLTHEHTPRLGKDYADYQYPVICISHNQARELKKKFNAQVFGVAYHGLDSFTHTATPEHAGYLAWIGRFLPDKGAHRAIEVARQAGTPLMIAGTIFERKPESQEHFDADIAPHITLHDPNILDRFAKMDAQQIRAELQQISKQYGTNAPIIFAGSASEPQKQALYGHAAATLFPIEWPEPFGRVMIESMACGTPVIANAQVGKTHCGSVDEIINEGVSGYKIKAQDTAGSIMAMANAVAHIKDIDRNGVRAEFDKCWTSQRLARDLDGLYRKKLGLPEQHENTLHLKNG